MTNLVATLTLPNHPLDGSKVQLVQQSPITGRWRVVLLHDRGAWRRGNFITVSPSEFVLSGMFHNQSHGE